MNATQKKKITSDIMAKFVKHFDLGLRYATKSPVFRMEDVPWLAEIQKADVEELLKKVAKLYECL